MNNLPLQIGDFVTVAVVGSKVVIMRGVITSNTANRIVVIWIDSLYKDIYNLINNDWVLQEDWPIVIIVTIEHTKIKVRK